MSMYLIPQKRSCEAEVEVLLLQLPAKALHAPPHLPRHLLRICIASSRRLPWPRRRPTRTSAAASARAALPLNHATNRLIVSKSRFNMYSPKQPRTSPSG